MEIGRGAQMPFHRLHLLAQFGSRRAQLSKARAVLVKGCHVGTTKGFP